MKEEQLFIKKVFKYAPNALNVLYALFLTQQALVGKTVTAFGPRSKGHWGGYNKPIPFIVGKIEPDKYSWMDLKQSDDKMIDYLGVNVFLQGYSTNSSYGMIYTDTTFKRSINTVLSQAIAPLKFDIDYTEQGMQGTTYVSMRLYVKKRII
jgi:hypothetical protein